MKNIILVLLVVGLLSSCKSIVTLDSKINSERGIDYTLKEILASKYIITEAMHGAIIADIYRIPWSRFVLSTLFTEGAMVSEYKWMDWLYSVGIYNIETTEISFYRKTRIKNPAAVRYFSGGI